ncbi:MAG: response regulator [Pseudomonadota bacterium]
MDHGSRILLLEDDFRQAAALQARLEAAGYVVDVVERADAAITRLRTLHYDLLVTDIYTDQPGRGGLYLVGMIKQAIDYGLPDLPIIAITGASAVRGAHPLSAYLEQLGVDAFLVKPIRPLELELAVEHLLTPAEP